MTQQTPEFRLNLQNSLNNYDAVRATAEATLIRETGKLAELQGVLAQLSAVRTIQDQIAETQAELDTLETQSTGSPADVEAIALRKKRIDNLHDTIKSGLLPALRMPTLEAWQTRFDELTRQVAALKESVDATTARIARAKANVARVEAELQAAS